MQINVQKYLDLGTNDGVERFEQTLKPAAVTSVAGVRAALQPLADAIIDAVAKNELLRASFTVTTTMPTTVSLETGIINMPLVNAKKAGNFFEIEEIVPVNIYLVTESPFLNASGLRIDLLGPSDTFASDAPRLLDEAAARVLTQLEHIAEEAARPLTEPEPAPAKKAAAKKTTAKKTSTKRAATKKTTTAKKTPAKKAAAKKPAAKKTTTRAKKVSE